MISKNRACLLAVAAAVLAACDFGVQTFRARDDGPPSVDSFVEAMKQGDVEAFVADLNEVRREQREPEVLTYLLSLWRDAHGEKAPNFLQNDLVLVELAVTLAQARRNAAMDVDEAELHEVIRRVVRSDDDETRQTALMGLASFADRTDVPILEQMTAHPDEATFLMAVITLSSTCLPESRVALDRAEPLLSKERAAFLAETRDSHGCRKER